MKNLLKNTLNQLGLIENNAVYFRNNVNGEEFHGFTSDIQKKIEMISPDAYYVFNNQPLILFFDIENSSNSKDRESSIHKQVWSFDNSPVVFIFSHNDIKVYNALNYNKADNSLEKLDLSNEEILNNFSFWNLQSGKTWKWLQNNLNSNNRKNKNRKRVNERLFENIKKVRETLINDQDGLFENEANSMILRLIFIRYLIDRDIIIDENYIQGSTLSDRRKSFSKLILSPDRLDNLFVKLNENFNGVLFRDVKVKLTNDQAKFLAYVFRGELQDSDSLFEDFYFDIFDFSIIPVEVISGIYESLIDPKTRNLQSAVYTPPFLVEYVLNDTIEKYLYENQISECKIFEVAVGSGIFLVQSLRRMIDKEIELNGNNDKKKFSERIRNIAKRNLYGLDINAEALKVTCFSIYIALLDYQSPRDIDKYPFPTLLGENLFEANYFDTQHEFNDIILSIEPKFILGNPPWKNGSKDKVHVKYLKENKLINAVSDYQLAQSFVLRTKDFTTLNNTPICSLIITSKSIYNNNAINFKKYFLKEFYLQKCLDLSAVRRLIFEKANNPAMILQFQYAKGEDTLQNIVIHQSLKQNIFIKKFNALVIEKRDNKRIQQELFYNYPWMFKVALYGGIIDFNLLKKLTELPVSIDAYLQKNKITNGNGIKKGTPKRYFDFLIGLPIIETSLINRYYSKASNDLNILKKEDVYLEAGRNEELFKGKKILLGKRTKNESEINVSFLEEDCVFRDSVNSITFSKENESEFYLLYSVFISNIFLYFQFLTSSNWGVYYPEIHKTEYFAFPLVNNESINKELKKLVDDFLIIYKNHYYEFNLGKPVKDETAYSKINNKISELYNITDYEKDLINYVLDVSRYQFQESKQRKVVDFIGNDYKSKDFVLKSYAEVFLKEFNTLYANEYIQVEIYLLEHFTAMNFRFLKNEPEDSIIYSDDLSEKDVLERLAKNLSISKITDVTDSSKNLFVQKDIKGFEKNSFYLIKPTEYKCWHRALAWHDVAEFKKLIEEAEMDEIRVSVNEF